MENSFKSLPELSKSIDEIKNQLLSIDNPSKAYKENLENSLKEVNDNILSLNTYIESVKQTIGKDIQSVNQLIVKLREPIDEFMFNATNITTNVKSQIANLTNPTKEFEQKLAESINDLNLKLASLSTPIDSHKINFIEELNKLREEIYKINNPEKDLKKLQVSELLDEIKEDDKLMLKFAKTVLDVSHPDDFVFPPMDIQLIPSITTLKVIWERAKNAQSYKVFYAPSGTLNFKEAPETLNTAITIVGLQQDSEYDVYIVSKGSGNKISSASEIVSTKTLKNN